MKDTRRILLEKRVKKLEEEIEAMPDIGVLDYDLHNELIDDLTLFIRQCNDKFTQTIGNANNDKSLKKTRSYKLIKALREDWVNSARK